MVASNDTIVQVIRVLKRHVDNATLRRIFADLRSVPGNKSFRDTIIKLEQELCQP